MCHPLFIWPPKGHLVPPTRCMQAIRCCRPFCATHLLYLMNFKGLAQHFVRQRPRVPPICYQKPFGATHLSYLMNFKGLAQHFVCIDRQRPRVPPICCCPDVPPIHSDSRRCTPAFRSAEPPGSHQQFPQPISSARGGGSWCCATRRMTAAELEKLALVNAYGYPESYVGGAAQKPMALKRH